MTYPVHHIFAAAAITLLLHPASALSQPEAVRQPAPLPTPQNVITTNPLALALGGTFNVEYERAIAPAVSVFIGPQIQFSSGIVPLAAGTSVFGLGVIGGARFYPFGDAPRGMFLSPQVSAAWVTVKNGSAEGSGSGFSIAALIGYQWLIARHFAISIGGGIQYYSVTANAASGTSTATADVAEVAPAARLALGGAF